MKKLLLSLGTIAAVAAPVATLVACGSNSGDDLPVLANGQKASKIFTYNFSDDMTKAEFEKNCKEYKEKLNGFYPTKEELVKMYPNIKDSKAEENKAEEDYMKKTSFPLFKVVYNKKTVSVDWSMDDGHVAENQKEMGKSIAALATKLGSNLKMDIS